MDKTYAKVLQQVLGLGVDVQLAALRVLGKVKSRDLGDVLVLALALLLLQLEGDTADGTALNALHQMRRVAGDLVTQALRGDDGNLIADALVGLEVEGQLGVVPLNDDLGGLLDGLGANATHVGGLCVVGGGEVVEVVVVVEKERSMLKVGRAKKNGQKADADNWEQFFWRAPLVLLSPWCRKFLVGREKGR